MTENKAFSAIKRLLTMTLALVMVLGAAMTVMTQNSYAAFTGKVGSKYTVHWYKELHYGPGDGGYSNAAKCDLGDDLGSRYSICVQPNKSSPVWSGDQTRTVQVDKVVTDATDTGKWNAMRNIIYYSPTYPGFKKNIEGIKQFYFGDEAKDFGVAHLALAWVYAGRPDSLPTWNGTSASACGEVWTKAKALANALYDTNADYDEAVPESFKIFICYMDGVQDMVVGYMEAPGHLKMKKVSNRTSITDGNSCYSVEGAKYTVYDKSGSSAGTLTVKANGESNTIDLMEGTYTVKETTAPPGYAKDTETYTVKVESDETTTFTAKDEPITDLIEILLTKNPAGYSHDHGEGDADLAGAVYEIKFYAGQYDTAAKAEASNTLKATWNFVTDANGKISGQNPVKAEGMTNSAFYKDKDGKIAYPLGTYVIREVKASEGYLLNNEKVVGHVTEDGTDNLHVKTYNEKLKGDETIIRGGVKLAKIDHELNEAYAQGDATLKGAEFTVCNQSKQSVMVGGKEIAKGDAALVITTNENGIATSDAHALPYGSYSVKETKAPTGYHLNTTWSKNFTIREDGVIIDLTDAPVAEDVFRGGLKVTKVDADTGKTTPQGDASIDGAELEIINNSAHDVLVKGTRYAKGQRVMTIRVSGGVATTGNKDLPYGHYIVKEIGTYKGYHLNKGWQGEVFIDQDGVIKEVDPAKIPNHVKRFGLKIQKIDNDLDTAYDQGDSTLEGAEFTIWNKSAQGVVTRDVPYLSDKSPAVSWSDSNGSMPKNAKEIAKDDIVGIIRTDASGASSTLGSDLSYGTYFIKETKPSKGYNLNEKWSFTIKVYTEEGKDYVKIAGTNNEEGVNETLEFTDGMIVDLAKYMTREPVIRGGVQIVKRDKEIRKSEKLGGASLEGITFTIKNVSEKDVVVRKDIGNTTDAVDWKKLSSKQDLFESGAVKRVKPGEDVGKIVTHWNPDKKAYTAETLMDDLPYGTYTVRESKTNDSYQRTDKTEHMFEVREEGVMVSFDDGKNEVALTFDDYVYRSDVQGTKIADSTSERFSYVPFKIISVANGETHVVVTDANGFFSTKDRRAAGDLDEDEDADTARKQNPFDDLLEAEDIKTADLEARKDDILHGVWFGTGEFGTKAEMKSQWGALPYDSYILEEMPCEHNEGYILQKFWFTVDQKTQTGFVDLETITDDVPEIGTTADVNGTNTEIMPAKEIKLTDTIEYMNLKKGEKYTAKGRLIDKATGEVCRDAAGKEIKAEKEFVARSSNGKVKVEFTFDGSLLYGKDTVVFEQVFDSEGHVTATHEDIEDEGQTVTWKHPQPSYEMYKIRTTKAPSKGDKYGFFAQDEVEYEVHVENTGNIALTMDVSDQFTQNPEYFTVPKLKGVKFDGEGTWNNKKDFVKDEKATDKAETAVSDGVTKTEEPAQIANITLNPGEKAVVTFTAVVSDSAKEYLAAAAKDSDSLDAKGHDINREYQKNKTDDHDGYWNTAKCDNVTYPNPENPDEPDTLEPKDDVAQTPVQKPEIGTTLTGDKNAKEITPSKETKLTDTVEYKGLDPSKWYILEGTLMVKDTGDPLIEHGHEVTVWSEPFQPKKSGGKVKVTFTIDTTNLEGKELVAFETAYRINGYKKGDSLEKTTLTQVAEHKDLKDEGQTVKITEKPAVPPTKGNPPKTGDTALLWLWGILFFGAMGAGLTIAVKETVRRHRERQEDLAMFA